MHTWHVGAEIRNEKCTDSQPEKMSDPENSNVVTKKQKKVSWELL